MLWRNEHSPVWQTSGLGRGLVRRFRRASALLALVLGASLLSACGGSGFQPLYGPTSRGTNVQDELAAIHILPIPGRVGQVLRNELIFKTTGGNHPLPPEYRLEIALRGSVSTQLVQRDADAQGGTYSLVAKFKLIRLSDKKVVLEGKDHARAAYQRFNEILSNVRARRDAENRAAKFMADSMRTRLAAYLASSV